MAWASRKTTGRPSIYIDAQPSKGYTPAMANLGRMYIEAQGVERNDVHGYALLQRAALTAGVPASMQPMANQELEAATRVSTRRSSPRHARHRRSWRRPLRRLVQRRR